MSPIEHLLKLVADSEDDGLFVREMVSCARMNPDLLPAEIEKAERRLEALRLLAQEYGTDTLMQMEPSDDESN